MDPLSPEERDEHEWDLIHFSDRELDLLGDISGLDVLYAGGAALLWLEGLSQRIGPGGNLTALDLDEHRLAAARERLPEADLAAPVRLVRGDVFDPPFEPDSFDLAYSAGLLHELDVSEGSAEAMLTALAATVRAEGRFVTSDFVDSSPAAQLEEEEIESRKKYRETGAILYGIGSPERLVTLYKRVLRNVRWQIQPPFPIRHLDRLFLAQAPDDARSTLRERVAREGYTRPATLYAEGWIQENAKSRRLKADS